MAANNFKVFNESKTNMMNDTDYDTHIQRENGVGSGLAVSTLHNKLYRQTSIAAKAVADFIASQELDATDNDSVLFSTNLLKALEKVTKVPLDGHRTKEVLDHPDASVTTPKIRDKSVTFNKLAGEAVDTIVNIMYPVGIIVEFAKDVDPNTVWQGTTWERMSNGRVLVSSGTSDSGTTYTLGATGGEESHKLTKDEMPLHNHYDYTDSSGGHNHGRGDMNITGDFWATVGAQSGAWGAFWMNGNGQGFTKMDSPYQDSRHFFFNAANTWTGNTSWNGDHTHHIKTDGGGKQHNNMQPYEVVNRWKRTA